MSVPLSLTLPVCVCVRAPFLHIGSRADDHRHRKRQLNTHIIRAAKLTANAKGRKAHSLRNHRARARADFVDTQAWEIDEGGARDEVPAQDYTQSQFIQSHVTVILPKRVMNANNTDFSGCTY